MASTQGPPGASSGRGGERGPEGPWEEHGARRGARSPQVPSAGPAPISSRSPAQATPGQGPAFLPINPRILGRKGWFRRALSCSNIVKMSLRVVRK